MNISQYKKNQQACPCYRMISTQAYAIYLFFLFLKEKSTLQKPVIQMLKFMVCPFRQRGSQRKTVSV